jgi:hypothetical protein
MKTKEVYYERKFNLGNYETESIGILVVVEEGEKFADVLNTARKAVLQQGVMLPKPKSAPVRELQAVLDKKTNGDVGTV